MVATLTDAAAALRTILSPPFRRVLLTILAITLGLIVVLSLMLRQGLAMLGTPANPWLAVPLSLVENLGLILAGIFLVGPVSALVAGFFVDDLADRLERALDPFAPPGTALPILQALGLSVRFALLSLLVMLAALALLLVPGVNGLVFLLANTYLAARQYFEFAALRYRPMAEATALRHAHPGSVYAAGFCIALMLAVPLVNLLTPLFGTALMVRVHRRIAPLPRTSVGAARPSGG